jgi:hypothetical protein
MRPLAVALAVALAAGAAATAAVGCGKSQATGGASGVSADAFSATMADAYCTALAGCCAAAGTPNDDAACRSQLTTAFQVPVDRMKGHGKVVYDPAAAATCAAAVKAREAMCADDGGAPSAAAGYVDPVTAACAGVFRGTVALGDPCTARIECQTSGDDSPDCVPGTDGTTVCAVTRSHATPDAGCTLVHVDHVQTLCEPSLGYCAYALDASPMGTCTAFLPIGAKCVGGAGKAPLCDLASAYCDGFRTGTCQPLPKLGEACPGGACEVGQGCDTSASPAVCVTTKADGDPCTVSGVCASGFCAPTTLADGGLGPGTCANAGAGLGSIFDVPRACRGAISSAGSTPIAAIPTY